MSLVNNNSTVSGYLEQLYSGINILSGDLSSTGAALSARDLAISGALAIQISSNAAGVSNLNGLSGSINLLGAGTNIYVSTSGTTNIYVSGSGIAQSIDLTNTGAVLFARDGSISGALDTKIAGTGLSLYNLVTGLSGQAINAYATITTTNLISGNLIQTGVQLSNLVAGASGGLEVRISATGNSTTAHANSVGSVISGNLTQTGLQIGLVSGAIATNLTNTGAALILRDAAISGVIDTKITASGALLSAVKITGSNIISVANFTGLGSVTVYTSGSTIYVSGVGGAGGGEVNTASNQGGATGLFAQKAGVDLQFNTIQGTGTIALITVGNVIYISGSGSVGGAGTVTQAQLDSLSGWSSGQFTTTGAQAWNAANANAVALSGALTQTGLQISLVSGAIATKLAATGAVLIQRDLDISGGLEVRIVASGQSVLSHANSIGATISGNLTSTGLAIGLVSGALDTKIAATGNQAWSAANINAITLSGALTQTGATLNARINSLSGYADSIYVHRTGAELISGAKTFVNNNQETFIIKSGLSNLLVVSGNATKIFLPNGTLILDSNQQVLFDAAANTSVDWSSKYLGDNSSVLSLDWQTRTLANSIGTTVANWNNRTLSNSIGVVANWGTSTLTGEWQTNSTGVASGTIVNFYRLTGVSGALQALIVGGGSVVKVSGSAAIPTADFTGIGGTVVLYSGGKVFISGAAAGVGGGVPSVNGISSAVTIAGTGGFNITTVGGTVYVSGLTTANGGQIIFSETGTLSGDANFTWDSLTDSLEIGQPRLNYPDNPLSLGGSGVYLQANIRNRSNKNDASSDFVMTSDAGSDISGYLDLGINGSNYNQAAYDMNASGDGYLYMNGGNLAIATSSTGDVIQFFTSGTRSFNLRMTVNDTGVNLPYSGILQVGERDRAIKIDGGSIGMNSGILTFTGIANNPIAGMLVSGWGTTYYGPALHNRRIKVLSPNTTTSQIVYGDTAANVGTLSTLSNETVGQITIYTPAAGLSAGTSFTLADTFRGTGPGVNGFFFVSKFFLNSNWASGLNIGTYGNPSGCRIFVGLTSQTVATQTDNNEPAGNYVGLRYLWASGGSVGTGQYMQNWAVGSRDNVNAFTGDAGMVFQTGKYRFAMFSPGYPGNNQVYYQLDDMTRGSGVKGVMATRLPIGSTAMRGMVAIGFVSGVKTIGTSTLYLEQPND